MPYKRREPVSDREMRRNRWEGHHTICQTLRDIYAVEENEDNRLKLRLATAMAKAMQERLKRYKEKEDARKN